MNAKSVCPIGCEYFIRDAWCAFGPEEAKPRKTEAAAASTPGATQGYKGEPSSNIKLSRHRWVSKIRSVTTCRGRHWPSTPDEIRQLQSRLLWGPADMWSAVNNRDDEARAKSARRSSHREDEQRTPQAPAPGSSAQQQEASRPTPVPKQRAAGPPASDGEGPRSDSEPVLSIQLPFICLRPPHQGMRWDLSHSERARRFAVKKSLIAVKEFQAMMWEDVEKHANAYLSKPPTERSVMEFQKDTESYYQVLARDLYKAFEVDMKRKLADIQNGVLDDDGLVDNRDTENNVRPDVRARQSGRIDESDRNGLSNEGSTPGGHQRDPRQTEEQFRQRATHPRTMPSAEPARGPDAGQKTAGYYPPRSADIHRNDSRIPSLERYMGSFVSDSRKSEVPQPVPTAVPHHQSQIDSLDGSMQYQGWGDHRRSQSDNVDEFGSLPSTQFLDPTYIPVRSQRQRMRSASASGDPRSPGDSTAGPTGGHYQYPSFPQPGRAAPEANSVGHPPPGARPDSAPIGRRVPPSSYGATPLRYMPNTVREAAPPPLPHEPEMIDPDAGELDWLDPYCSDQYISDQYTDVANAFIIREFELDKELSETLSDLEEGRHQKTSRASANARAPVRSGVPPKSPRVPIKIPPLVASEGSNADSDSDATVSDSTIQTESESDETPTQSTFNSPLAGVHTPRALSSFVGQKPPTTTRQTALRAASRQAVERVTRPERREVHFAEAPAVRYFKN